MSEKQYIIFNLEKEQYAVDIMNVQEISEYTTPTPIPDSYDFIEGVINLRGGIIPVINLKKRMSILSEKNSTSNRIIIINIGTSQIGVVVDEASQVLTFDSDEIKSTPSTLENSEKKLISGIGNSNDRIVMFVDFNRILEEDDLKSLV